MGRGSRQGQTAGVTASLAMSRGRAGQSDNGLLAARALREQLARGRQLGLAPSAVREGLHAIAAVGSEATDLERSLLDHQGPANERQLAAFARLALCGQLLAAFERLEAAGGGEDHDHAFDHLAIALSTLNQQRWQLADAQQQAPDETGVVEGLLALAHVQAVLDPRLRASTEHLSRSGAVAEHAAALAPLQPQLRVQVIDRQWLELLSDDLVRRDAVRNEQMGVVLGDDHAQRLLRVRRGRLDPVLLHELVHTTQPACSGDPVLVEGVTQALVNHLLTQRHQPTPAASYPVEVEVAMTLARARPEPLGDALRALNGLDEHQLWHEAQTVLAAQASPPRARQQLIGMLDQARQAWRHDPAQALKRLRQELGAASESATHSVMPVAA